MPKMLTMQKVFDKIWERAGTKVLAQAENSGDCLYRTPEGLCCFIGALIPNDVYDPEIEGASLSRDDASGKICIPHIFDNVLRASGIDTENPELVSLLEKCQRIHDSERIVKWDNKLQELAEQYDLTVPERKNS